MCARVPFGRMAPSRQVAPSARVTCHSQPICCVRVVRAGVSHLASQGAIPASLVAMPQCHLRATTLVRVVSSGARAIVGVSVESREWLKLRRRGAHL